MLQISKLHLGLLLLLGPLALTNAVLYVAAFNAINLAAAVTCSFAFTMLAYRVYKENKDD